MWFLLIFFRKQTIYWLTLSTPVNISMFQKSSRILLTTICFPQKWRLPKNDLFFPKNEKLSPKTTWFFPKTENIPKNIQIMYLSNKVYFCSKTPYFARFASIFNSIFPKTEKFPKTTFLNITMLISTLHYPVFCKNDLATTKSVCSIVSLFINHFRCHYCYCYRILYLGVSLAFLTQNHYIYI